MGPNILVGIASTKFIGVIVLGFASSEMFRIYYFRMYMAIIVLGVFQGLIVMPIVLSYIGPVSKGRSKDSVFEDTSDEKTPITFEGNNSHEETKPKKQKSEQ